MIAAFCDPFDEALAARGPASVFLFDQEGLLRFDANWTRDAWTRTDGLLPHGWSWRVLRDRDTGFVQVVLATSPLLLVSHPRADVRGFDLLDEAMAVRDQFGSPPVSREPW
ncbi:MAG: hypothetical protein JXX28_02000 [Deltaproteobacteria bacterium]|nr:hypothetical protein [Deltaproteobacteria bacterium]